MFSKVGLPLALFSAVMHLKFERRVSFSTNINVGGDVAAISIAASGAKGDGE
eukprot:COSAG02_NODE_968_length_15583_cov_13.420369_7_plen_52_part_00